MSHAVEPTQGTAGLGAPVVVSIPDAALSLSQREDSARNGHAPTTGSACKPACTTPAAPVGARPTPGEPGMLFFGANRRSGTTWLAGILNAHPEISCRNEGWLLTHREGSADNWLDRKNLARWAQMKAPNGQYVQALGDRGLARAIQRGMMKEVVKQAILAEGWKEYPRLKWIGDKTTTHYCTKVDFLHELFPDGRFLYMQRDGRDVVVSDMFLMFRAGSLGSDDDLTLEQVRDIERARRFHFEGEGPPVPLFTRSTIRHFVGNWVECVSGGLRAKSLFAGSFHEVRYERMVADPLGTVRELFEWLGVQTDDDFLHWVIEACKFENFAEGRKPGQANPKAEWRKGIIGDWRNYLTEDDKAVFKRMAGGLLIELGYEKDLNW